MDGKRDISSAATSDSDIRKQANGTRTYKKQGSSMSGLAIESSSEESEFYDVREAIKEETLTRKPSISTIGSGFDTLSLKKEIDKASTLTSDATYVRVNTSRGFKLDEHSEQGKERLSRIINDTGTGF
jgi:hypothetical protein